MEEVQVAGNEVYSEANGVGVEDIAVNEGDDLYNEAQDAVKRDVLEDEVETQRTSSERSGRG